MWCMQAFCKFVSVLRLNSVQWFSGLHLCALYSTLLDIYIFFGDVNSEVRCTCLCILVMSLIIVGVVLLEYILSWQIPSNHGGLIEYRAHPFWVQKYCPSHEHDGTPRCCSCERMEVSLSEIIVISFNKGSLIIARTTCEPCVFWWKIVGMKNLYIKCSHRTQHMLRWMMDGSFA